ncbi:MAG: hypothetical protein U0R52_01395 [Solirubrobacterales bacterium]
MVVETDGYRYHRGRQAFEDDRARDLEPSLAGFRVVRLTHRQVSEMGGKLARRLEILIGSGSDAAGRRKRGRHGGSGGDGG